MEREGRWGARERGPRIPVQAPGLRDHLVHTLHSGEAGISRTQRSGLVCPCSLPSPFPAVQITPTAHTQLPAAVKIKTSVNPLRELTLELVISVISKADILPFLHHR